MIQDYEFMQEVKQYLTPQEIEGIRNEARTFVYEIKKQSEVYPIA